MTETLASYGLDRTLYTHVRPDLDAVLSVAAVRLFVPAFSGVDVTLVPADWDGQGLRDSDLAVDLEAGGRGIKGRQDPDGTVHSAFAAVVERFGSPEDQKALEALVRFVDAQDAHGSAVAHLAPGLDDATREILAATGINAVLRALQALRPHEPQEVFDQMQEILAGFLTIGRARVRAEAEADRADYLHGGLAVPILRGAKEFQTNGILFRRGALAVVYADGNNLGVIRREDVEARMDDERIRALIREAGEEDRWYFHPGGFLAAHGSRKAPAREPSRVDPARLARVVAEVVGGARTGDPPG